MFATLVAVAIGAVGAQANDAAQKEYSDYLARMDKLESAVAGIRSPGTMGTAPSVTALRLKEGGRFAMIGDIVEEHSDGKTLYRYSALKNAYMESGPFDRSDYSAIFGRTLFPTKAPAPVVTEAADAKFQLREARCFTFTVAPNGVVFRLFVDKRTHLPIGWSESTPQIYSEIEIVGFLPNPGLPDSAVTWSPPEGARKTTRVGDLRYRGPRTLD